MQRRIERLEPVIAKRFPSPLPPVDASRLTAEEWEEVRKINTICTTAGWDALSWEDLDLLEDIALRLATATDAPRSTL